MIWQVFTWKNQVHSMRFTWDDFTSSTWSFATFCVVYLECSNMALTRQPGPTQLEPLNKYQAPVWRSTETFSDSGLKILKVKDIYTTPAGPSCKSDIGKYLHTLERSESSKPFWFNMWPIEHNRDLFAVVCFNVYPTILLCVVGRGTGQYQKCFFKRFLAEPNVWLGC